MTEFIILGTPVAKERPRVGRSGKFYTPAKTHNYESLVGWSYLKLHSSKRQKYLKGTPVEMEIEFYFKVPESFSKKKKDEALSKKIFPTRKDIDNIEKCILDGLNNVAYDDDSQVVKVKKVKYYGAEDYVRVRIGEYKHDKQTN